MRIEGLTVGDRIMPPFELADSDIAEGEKWLERRMLDIDGDFGLINWKDHIIASVVAMARKAKPKKKEAK